LGKAVYKSAGSVVALSKEIYVDHLTGHPTVFSVAMLTIGIIMAAMGDAQAKVLSSGSQHENTDMLIYIIQGKTNAKSTTKLDSDFISGLAILFVAQLLSAIMGLYTQLTYAKYGSHWHENLFYSHALSIPLFSLFFPFLLTQFRKLLTSEPLQLSPLIHQATPVFLKARNTTQETDLSPILAFPTSMDTIPKHIFTLGLNALTQYACIRGVNLLGARTSALGVSIVLNVRKLVSLFLSIWLFGNKLPPGVMLGAAVVFGSAGIWAWEGQRIGRRESEKKDGKKE